MADGNVNSRDIKDIWFHQGIRISCQNREESCTEPLTVPEYGVEDAVRMMFVLSGGLKLRVLTDGRFHEVKIVSGYCGLYYHPNACYKLHLSGKSKVQAVYITFPCRMLLDFLEGCKISHDIKTAIKGRQPVNRTIPITPPMDSVINQILAPWVHGNSVNLFFLAKVLDLLGSFLNDPDEARLSPVNGTDMELIQRAMSILEASLEDAPSVEELATRLGVSASKLKQLFPKACGIPPYAYLRKARMAKAMSLLNEGKANVTEVAYDVGYNSISHFTKVFTKHFGIKPSQIRRSF